MRARSSFQVITTSVWSSLCSLMLTLRSALTLPLRISLSHE
jgi:hypothetical protein